MDWLAASDPSAVAFVAGVIFVCILILVCGE